MAKLLPLLVVALALVAGCTAKRMDVVPATRRVTAPSPGAALVIFFRKPESAFPANVLDDEYYVGTIYADSHVAYVTKPGRHLFVVATDVADFMEADLLADRTYYVFLSPHWGGRFTFVPLDHPEVVAEAKAFAARSRQMQPNAEGRRWVESKRANIRRMRAERTPSWEATKHRITLRAESGQP